MKIVTVVGARPQFIKAGAVSKALRLHRPDIQEIILHTGQHYDYNMSDIFFQQLQIAAPEIHLGIGGGSHGENTGRMLEQIEKHLLSIKPDWVLVYGDTDSTIAAALAASKLGIKIAHVEAGLRSFNMNMPEEINRILTDRISNILFCTSELAIHNLACENITNGKDYTVINCGDVMYDSILNSKAFMQQPQVQQNFPEKFALFTLHRASNTDDKSCLESILKAIKQLANNVDVVFPVHPRTTLALKKYDITLEHDNLHILPPQSYFEFLWLLANCSLVLTDSGGLQKEAYFFDKPCIILRNETEWKELLGIGNHHLVGHDFDEVVGKSKPYLCSSQLPVANNRQLYGQGNAAELIARQF